MTWQSETRAWALAIAGAFALGAVGFRVLTLPQIPDVTPIVAHLDAATGAWANASKQQVQSVAAIERDLRAEMWHIDRTLLTVNDTLRTAQGTLTGATVAVSTVNEQMKAVGPLLASARQATDAISPTLQAAQGALGSIQPAVTDFQDFLKQPTLMETLSNVNRMTGSGAAIIGDAQKVSDKMTADYLKPVPWYLKPIKRGGEIIDITAAIARHTP